jgi:hypothetical protein
MSLLEQLQAAKKKAKHVEVVDTGKPKVTGCKALN